MSVDRQNNLSNINESSSYKKLSCTIDDVEIKPSYIQDLEIHWEDDFRVNGYIKINDIFDLSNNVELDDDKIINIYVTDLYDTFYSRDFKITNIKEKKSMNDKVTIIEFQDVISWELQNTYIPKSFQATKASDMFLDFMSLKADSLLGTVQKQIASTSISHPLYVVPTNINFLDFILGEFNKEGYILYQTYDKIILEDAKNLIPSVLETVEFEYKESKKNQHYGFNIIDYSAVLADTKAVSKNPVHSVLVYNPATKTMDEFKQNLEDVYSDLQVTGKANVTQKTNGACIKTQEYLIDNNLYLDTIKASKDNSGVDIMVPGNITYSSVFKKMDILLMGNSNSTESIKSGDVKLSGVYVCYKVKDKFIPGQKFIQQLILKRVDLGAK